MDEFRQRTAVNKVKPTDMMKKAVDIINCLSAGERKRLESIIFDDAGHIRQTQIRDDPEQQHRIKKFCKSCRRVFSFAVYVGQKTTQCTMCGGELGLGGRAAMQDWLIDRKMILPGQDVEDLEDPTDEIMEQFEKVPEDVQKEFIQALVDAAKQKEVE